MSDKPYACRNCGREYESRAKPYCSACPEGALILSKRLIAKLAKMEAIERVTRNTDPRWATLAYMAINRVARERETFTATDVWLVIEARPHEPRALAGILRRAARNGLIEATPDFRASGVARNHGRPERVWRSLVKTEER